MKTFSKIKNLDLVKETLADFKKRQEMRRTLDSMWLLNINYYIGNQYAEIAPSGNIEDYGKQYYWQQREVFNRIAPLIETRLSRLSRVDLDVSVRPLTSEESEREKAKFSNKLIASFRDDNYFQNLISEACFYSEITGTAFYKVCWNSSKGRLIGVNGKDSIYEGDIELSVCPPYEIYPDSLSMAEPEDCQSIIHAKAYPVEEIERLWGVKTTGKEVSVMNLESTSTGGGLGYGAYSSRIFSGTKYNHAMVIEKYCRPTDEYPDGRLIIIAGDKLVYDGILPYQNGVSGKRGYPFVRQVALSHPASFFGSSIIERLIPVQRAYNAVKNRRHEFLNRVTMGILTVEDGSVNIEHLEEEGLAPGRVIVYRQGATPPSMVTYGNVPGEFFEEEKSLEKEFSNVSGISDFMSSSELMNVNLSGTAINLLLEQDEARISITVNSLKSAIKKTLEMVIRLYKQFAEVKRLLRVSGKNHKIETAYFTGDDLSCDDLIFDSGASVSSMSARQNMVFEMLKLGLLNDAEGKISEENKVKTLELLGFGNWEQAKSDEELHIEKAKYENEMFRRADVEISEIDNHELHLSEHTRAAISTEFELSKEGAERLMRHVAAHKAKIEAEQIKKEGEKYE